MVHVTSKLTKHSVVRAIKTVLANETLNLAVLDSEWGSAIGIAFYFYKNRSKKSTGLVVVRASV